MTSSRVSPRKFQGEVWAIPPAIVLGTSAALFVNGYWLIDLLPIESRQIVLLTVLAAVAAAAGYFFFLRLAATTVDRARPRESNRPWIAGPACWQLRSFWRNAAMARVRTVYQFPASASPSCACRRHRRARQTAVALTWFNTSFGDISFATLGGRDGSARATKWW